MSERVPISYGESSGNVFADLGLPDPDALLVKTDLMLRIRDELATRKWDASHAATALGVSLYDIEQLDTSDPDALTIDILAKMLVSLGYDVAIRVSPSSSRTARFTTELATPTLTAASATTANAAR